MILTPFQTIEKKENFSGLGFSNIWSIKKKAQLDLIKDLKKDEQALQEYADGVGSATNKSEFFEQTLGKASKQAQDFAPKIVAGTDSVEGFKRAQTAAATATKSVGIASKAATVGVKALNIAMNVGVTVLASIAIQKTIEWINDLATSQQRAIETANELTTAYKQNVDSAKSNISTLEGLKNEFNKLSKGVDENGKKISVLAAPAIRANFANYKKLFGYLKSLGVKIFYDVSFGADITVWAYLKYMKKYNVNSIIAQPCPAVINYIEKNNLDLLNSLCKVQSPLLCSATYIKKYLKEDSSLAFLSPCIAKKDEIMNETSHGFVNYNVTFKKLSDYIINNNIDLNKYEEINFNDNNGLGFLFSRPGGLKENIQAYNENLWVRQIEGQEVVYDYLDEYGERVKKTYKCLM